MYAVDDKDRVIPFLPLPAPHVSAPDPLIFASEGTCHKLYLTDEYKLPGHPALGEPDYVDTEVRIVARFRHLALMLGPPNDEAFQGHPLASRRLVPYGCYEILSSSWIRMLERMNSVHHRHTPAFFEGLQHIIITFHDSTFECVTRGVTWDRDDRPLKEIMANDPHSLYHS